MQEQTQNKPTTASRRARELSAALNHFYANPVARVSLELFLTIGLVMFLGIFAIRPTLVTMSDLLREIEEKQELDTALTRKVASLQTAQYEYAQIEPRLEILNEAIPEQPEVIKAAKIIEKIAADNQIIIQNMSIADIPDETDPNVSFTQKTRESVGIAVSVTGDYVSIREFVEDLRNSRKSFVVESVVFSLQEERGSRKLSANVTIGTPYFGVATGTTAGATTTRTQTRTGTAE